MAKITQVHVKGKIGMLVCYDRQGTPCTRVQAEDVKQTEATKRSAQNFGKAVKIAKFIRQGLKPAMPDLKERYAEYRLNEAVGKVLPQLLPAGTLSKKDPYGLRGLELNPKTTLADRFTVPVTIDWSQPGLVMLNMPEFNPVKQIKALLGSQQLHFKVAVSGSKLGMPIITGAYTVAFDVDYTDALLPARSIALPFNVQPGTLNTVLLSLEYTVLKKGYRRRLTDPRWLPVGIIGAWYQQAG